MSQTAVAEQQLRDAFELFNQVSEQLAGSYQVLQRQVVALNQKLESSHAERQQLLAEIQTLQQQVDRSQRLSRMGQMTARLAHQIRTPLATALLYASQLKQTRLGREQHDCFVDRLLVGLRHLDHMVNDMLVFARGGQEGDETVVLDGLLEQVHQTLLPQMEQQRAHWCVHTRHSGLSVRGQSEVLASVLANLATNALNACGQGARLDWCLERHEGAVSVTLQDNGPGVREDLRDAIFEPFFTTRSNGTGLGLAVVRAVIKAHRGSIELDPQCRDGARFVLRLPLLDNDQQLPSRMLPSRPKAGVAESRCVE
jgi:two-component system sensor histidine kinase FlrB